jgi:acyl carrier protein
MRAPEATIREFVETKFRVRAGGRPLDDDTPLFSSGIVDSFGVLELIAFLEETFAIEIDTDMHELRDFDTVRAIAGLVARVSGGSGAG